MRFSCFSTDWATVLSLITLVVATKFKKVGVFVSTGLVSLSALYQYPELGVLMFVFYFLGLTLMSGSNPDHVLIPMALFVYPNPLLQSMLIPIIGVVYGASFASVDVLLYTVLAFIYSTFSGLTSFGYFVNTSNQTLFQAKDPLTVFSLSRIAEVFGQSDFSGMNVLSASLTTSPIHIFQVVFWTAIAAIPGYALSRRKLYASSWVRSAAFIFSANLLLFLTYQFSVGGGTFRELSNPMILLSPMFFFAVLGSIFSALIFPFIRFYYTTLANGGPVRASESRSFKREAGDSEVPAAVIPNLKWDDVGGLKSVKQELREALELPVTDPKLYDLYKIKPAKGVLLFGPPGCGKTVLVKVIASQIKAHFREIKGSDVLSKWFGDSEQRIVKVFSDLRKETPSILCVDEAEALFPSRDSSTSEAKRGIVSTFLSEMDGVSSTSGVFIIALTNKPEQIDEALMRPGRFDKLIYIPPPDLEARESIFRIHLGGRPVGPDVDFKRLADLSERWSGADIELVCNEAAASVAKEAQQSKTTRPIAAKDIEDLIGRRRPSISLASIRKYEEFKLKYERRALVSEDESQLIGHVEWGDVGGYEDVKSMLRESVEYPITHSDIYEKYNVKPPKGIIFYGPPGTGKTLLVKALASQSKANFFSVRGPEVLNKWVGESEARIRELFDSAREKPPSIIFFDEIDAIASKRSMNSSNDVTARIVSQLLTEMDGVEASSKIVVIAATNRLDMIDEALLRPGRFDKLINVPLPDAAARKAIFEVHLKGRPLIDVNIDNLVSQSEGFSGAEIGAVCNEAAMDLLREEIGKPLSEVKKIDMKLMEKSLKLIQARRIMGQESKGEPNNGEEEKPKGTIW